MKRILSLGAGVQSTTVLLMSCIGELPKLDAAIFADPGWERKRTYQHLDWLEVQAQRVGIEVHRVSAGNIKQDALLSQVRGTKAQGQRWASMPLYTRELKQVPGVEIVAMTESLGMIKRQCTKEYKIEPIERKLRELLGYKPRQVMPTGAVVQWFGISRDEMRRARLSRKRWITNHYPLIFDVPSTRYSCEQWLRAHELPIPPRSACIGCPFHSDAEWRDIKDNDPDEWTDACAFDQAIRNCGGMRGQMFLHRTCKPLAEVDLSTREERGQMSLWNQECQGMCGV
jgi:hypothetical protein